MKKFNRKAASLVLAVMFAFTGIYGCATTSTSTTQTDIEDAAYALGAATAVGLSLFSSDATVAEVKTGVSTLCALESGSSSTSASTISSAISTFLSTIWTDFNSLGSSKANAIVLLINVAWNYVKTAISNASDSQALVYAQAFLTSFCNGYNSAASSAGTSSLACASCK